MSSKKNIKKEVIETSIPVAKDKINSTIEKTSFWSKFIHYIKSDWIALLLVIANTALLYILSLYNDGFYQGEEANHYINMKSFWNDPSIIMGSSNKPGFKILFVIPALFGQMFARIFQCLIASLIVYFTYRIAKLKNYQFPLLVFLLFMTSPLWAGVSFRYYPEITGALFLVLSLYCHFLYPNSKILAAFFLSYAMIIRGEFMFVALPYFIYLFLRKDWKAIIALGIFPFIINLLGFIETKDIFYFINDNREYAAWAKVNYAKAGFDHYFVMSGVCFGYVLLVGFFLYTILALFKKVKFELILFFPFVIYFFLHCLMNWKGGNILSSTAGNLRYIITILPLAVLLSLAAFTRFFEMKQKFLYLFLFVFLIFFIGYALTYDHNWIERAKWLPRNYMPLYFSPALILFLILPLKNKYVYFGGIALFSLIGSYLFFKPIKLIDSGENHTAKELVDWVKKYNYQDTRPIYQVLPTFNYFFDKTPEDYKFGMMNLIPSELDKSKVGSIIIWDSHFALKFGKVEKSYFDTRPDKYLQLDQKLSPDKRVEFYIYERINK